MSFHLPGVFLGGVGYRHREVELYIGIFSATKLCGTVSQSDLTGLHSVKAVSASSTTLIFLFASCAAQRWSPAVALTTSPSHREPGTVLVPLDNLVSSGSGSPNSVPDALSGHRWFCE